MTQATCGLHWWTATLPGDASDAFDRIPGTWGIKERRGGYNQPWSSCHETGMRLYFGSQKEGQPVVMSATGEVCELYAAQIVDWTADLRGKVTRVDLACDVGPEDRARARLIEMKRAFVRGKCETDMRPTSFDEHRSHRPDEGWTMYFGSAQSRQFLRGYDRRGPLRLEWQWKPGKELGKYVPQYVQQSGAVSVWRSLSQALVFPMPWYRDLLEGETVEIAAEPDMAAEFDKVVMELQKQWGHFIGALDTVGFDLRDLAVRPERPHRNVVAKFKRWADGATASGYDGAALDREIEQWKLKYGRGRGGRPAK